MAVRPQVQTCPCCNYDYGSYLPRHCTDSHTCTWFKCKECLAVCRSDGSTHYSERAHPHVPPPPPVKKEA